MKIKTEINMDKDDFIAMFYDHYIEEKSFAWEYIRAHSDDNGQYDETLSNIVINAMNVKFYDFRFAFGKYVYEECKIDNYNMDNLVAFGLTLEYFGIKSIEILS